jgi:hypothetical protein
MGGGVLTASAVGAPLQALSAKDQRCFFCSLGHGRSGFWWAESPQPMSDSHEIGCRRIPLTKIYFIFRLRLGRAATGGYRFRVVEVTGGSRLSLLGDRNL